METPTLQQLSYLFTAPDVSGVPQSKVFLRKLGGGLILLVSDVFFLALSIFVSFLLRGLILSSPMNSVPYLSIMPFILASLPLIFFLRGLYPGFGIDVIKELRLITYSTTIVFAIFTTISFLMKDPWDYSRMIYLSSWILATISVPLGRSLVRKIFGSKSWWGIPVIIIGAGGAGEKVIRSLQKHAHIGLKPIVAVDDDIDRWGYIDNIPVIGGLETLPELAKKLNIDHSIIAMPSVSRKRQQEIIKKYSKFFTHTTVIPDLFGLSSLWVSTRDIGGILGLEVQQRLLKRSSYWKKRAFDITLSLLLGVIAMPIILLVSILIFIDSRGGAFFKQVRMGINNTRFKIIKFRTMHLDAEKKLSVLLNHNQDLREEYERYHKMQNDPRLTRIGKFIRKFSLDELPQFINVLKGEMSLIGPRAYIPWEKVKMLGHDEMILKVAPGISGLWQVTDRNASDFEERLITDVHYIRNWSMFLDIYILARTISVVFMGRGA